MALTVGLTGDWLQSQGNRKASSGTITFDTGYLGGGEVLTAAMVGLGNLESLELEQGEDGYIFEWIRTNQTTGLVKVRGVDIPTLIVEEQAFVHATLDTSTLRFLPAYIVAADAITATGTARRCHVVPVGETPAAGDVAVNFLTGVMTWNATDDMDTVRVTYFPQKPGTLFDPANMVIDELVLADNGANGTALTNPACLIQYVWNDGNNVNCAIDPVGEDPGANDNVVAIDLIGSGGVDTEIRGSSNDVTGVDSYKVTYILNSGLTASGATRINDTDLTLNSEAWDFMVDGLQSELQVPGFGTHCVGEETADNQDVPWAGPSHTAAENEPVWNPFGNDILTNQTGTMTTLAMGWVRLPINPASIAGVQATAYYGLPNQSRSLRGNMTEVQTGVDLSAVVVRFRAIGW